MDSSYKVVFKIIRDTISRGPLSTYYSACRSSVSTINRRTFDVGIAMLQSCLFLEDEMNPKTGFKVHIPYWDPETLNPKPYV